MKTNEPFMRQHHNRLATSPSRLQNFIEGQRQAILDFGYAYIGLKSGVKKALAQFKIRMSNH